MNFPSIEASLLTGNSSPEGEAVQVVSLHGQKDNRKLKLHTKVLRSIVDEAHGYDIATFAIAGPARGGKSFILTYIIRYLKALEKAKNGEVGDWMEKNDPDKSMLGQGFSFRNGTELASDGIWLWSRPFIVQQSPNRPPVAILVIDTQGCFASTFSDKDESSMIGLSLLASSCFIFNESTKINENTLMTLAKFMQYGQLATQSFDEKSFQQLIFLVRDWNMPSTHPYGAGGGQQFLRASMIPKVGNMSLEAVDCRNAILNSFEQQDAYLMPHPGDAVIDDKFTGSIGEMNESFQSHIERFVVGLVADVDTKKVSNTVINGTSFYSLFESYLAAFNSDEMPSPASILKANLLVAFESILQKQVLFYQAKFEEKLGKSKLPFQPIDTLHNWNDNIAKQIMQAFDQKANIGTSEEKAAYSQKLQNQLERCFSEFNNENEERKNGFIESSERKSLEKFKKYVEKDILPAPKFWTLDEFSSVISKAEKVARSKFLQACTGMPKNFIEAQNFLFNSNLESIKSSYWNELYDRRMSAENELYDILQEIEADYDDFMTAATNEEIVTETFLENLHQRQLASATRQFERKVRHIADSNFLRVFFEDLMSRLNFKYETIKFQNQSKTAAFLAEIEKDIEDAVCLLREELDRLVPDSHPSDFTAFDQVYDEILAIGSEQLEELAAIERRTHLEYQKKLEKSLKQVLLEAKEAVKNLRTARQERCHQFVQAAVNEFTLQLDQIIKVRTEELTSAVTSIRDSIRSTLRSKLLTEDPEEVTNFLSEYLELTEVEQKKVRLNNVEQLKRFENDGLKMEEVEDINPSVSTGDENEFRKRDSRDGYKTMIVKPCNSGPSLPTQQKMYTRYCDVLRNCFQTLTYEQLLSQSCLEFLLPAFKAYKKMSKSDSENSQELMEQRTKEYVKMYYVLRKIAEAIRNHFEDEDIFLLDGKGVDRIREIFKDSNTKHDINGISIKYRNLLCDKLQEFSLIALQRQKVRAEDDSKDIVKLLRNIIPSREALGFQKSVRDTQTPGLDSPQMPFNPSNNCKNKHEPGFVEEQDAAAPKSNSMAKSKKNQEQDQIKKQVATLREEQERSARTITNLYHQQMQLEIKKLEARQKVLQCQQSLKIIQAELEEPDGVTSSRKDSNFSIDSSTLKVGELNNFDEHSGSRSLHIPHGAQENLSNSWESLHPIFYQEYRYACQGTSWNDNAFQNRTPQITDHNQDLRFQNNSPTLQNGNRDTAEVPMGSSED